MAFKLDEGQHRFTRIHILDDMEYNAYHKYAITDVDDENKVYSLIAFQKGPVKESGKNGLFMEDLLNICKHRLECFQRSAFACHENQQALDKICEALMWLDKRTKDRQSRGVEGTNRN